MIRRPAYHETSANMAGINQPQPELTNGLLELTTVVQTHRRSASSPSHGPSSEVPDYEPQGEEALKFSGTSAQ